MQDGLGGEFSPRTTLIIEVISPPIAMPSLSHVVSLPPLLTSCSSWWQKEERIGELESLLEREKKHVRVINADGKDSWGVNLGTRDGR